MIEDLPGRAPGIDVLNQLKHRFSPVCRELDFPGGGLVIPTPHGLGLVPAAVTGHHDVDLLRADQTWNGFIGLPFVEGFRDIV